MNNFIFEEKGHRYTLDGKPMTGVTTILGVLAKPALIPWASKMGVEAVEQAGEVADDVLTVKGWSKAKLEAIKAHARKKEDAGSKGTDVHSLVESYIKDCIEHNHGYGVAKLKEAIDGDLDPMLSNFIQWSLSNVVRFLASEKQVYSKEWFVAGTFDFSFEKDGKRFIGDLKTMKKMWDRVPFFQTAAYRKMSIEMGEEPYDGSCIVNISKEDGHELTDHWSYDWENDQKAFEACLTLYRQLNNF